MIFIKKLISFAFNNKFELSFLFLALFLNVIVSPLVQKLFPIGISLAIPLDNLIPLIPIFIIPYQTHLLYMVFVVYLIWKDNLKRKKLVLAYFLVSLLSIITYIICQTEMIRPIIFSQDFFSNWIKLLYLFDSPTNAFPSLHVGLMTCALYFLDKKRIFVFIWGLLIILAVLFIKQHFILDLLGGLLYALVSILIASIVVDKFYFKK